MWEFSFLVKRKLANGGVFFFWWKENSCVECTGPIQLPAKRFQHGAKQSIQWTVDLQMALFPCEPCSNDTHWRPAHLCDPPEPATGYLIWGPLGYFPPLHGFAFKKLKINQPWYLFLLPAPKCSGKKRFPLCTEMEKRILYIRNTILWESIDCNRGNKGGVQLIMVFKKMCHSPLQSCLRHTENYRETILRYGGKTG